VVTEVQPSTIEPPSEADCWPKLFEILGVGVHLREVEWVIPRHTMADEQGYRRVLVAETGEQWRSLSWAMFGGGVSKASRYVCAEVRNADLPLGVEPRAVVQRFLDELGYEAGVVTLTSANVAAHVVAGAREDDVVAGVLVTAGLANALRVGEPSVGPPRRYLPDTINMACWVNVPLTLEGQLEALSIVTQARTLAVLEAKVPSLDNNGWASGTGTDCVALFSLDRGGANVHYAGLHTVVGRVLGRAARHAVTRVVGDWKRSKERTPASAL
jgi:adenosylcobinamide amidohydrolase